MGENGAIHGITNQKDTSKQLGTSSAHHQNASQTMRLAIIHELPLEYYPPITNFIEYATTKPNIDLSVFSTHNSRGRTEYHNSAAKICRPNSKITQGLGVLRILNRFRWHFEVARRISKLSPETLLYFEPHSAFAAFLYYKVFGGKAKLFIHHHEYYTISDYLHPQNKTIRYFHRLERSTLYPRANWISQTNSKRLEFFATDHPQIPVDKLRILPNLPPERWSHFSTNARSHSRSKPLKLVYIGSVSLSDTYIEDLVRWVKQKTDKEVTLDVFAYQVDQRTKEFLQANSGSNLFFHSQGIDYNDIPKKLQEFHVGLILYKGNTVNFQHNATNKLFEYLACGLDVWFAEGLRGVEPYCTSHTYPRVLSIRFPDLPKSDMLLEPDRNQLLHRPWQGFCETEFETLLQEMQK